MSDPASEIVFVLASAEGHAVAVLDSKDEARSWAADDARRHLEDGEVLSWSMEYSDAAPQWTELHAKVGATLIASYVITELPSLRPAATGPIAQRRSIIPGDPQALSLPPAAATPDGPSEPVAAPQAATEAAENAETGDLPRCEGQHEGCNGTVETAVQVEVSSFRQGAPLCKSCLAFEAANDISPRLAK